MTRKPRKKSPRRQLIADMRLRAVDPLVVMTTDRRLRLAEHRAAAERLEKELRVLECFAELRHTWAKKTCRHKIRTVLSHDVALSPSELSYLLGEKLTTVESTLRRMRIRGEVQHAGHRRWIRKKEESHVRGTCRQKNDDRAGIRTEHVHP